MLNELERSQALSDEVAINDYINGNSDSYDLLYRRHSPGLLRFIIMFLSISKILAEDLMQEIFMKVIVNRDKYMPSAKFTTWLYAIARYHCIDYIKTEQYRKHRSLDTSVSGEDGGAILGDFISRDDETQEKFGDFINRIIATIKGLIFFPVFVYIGALLVTPVTEIIYSHSFVWFFWGGGN